MRKIVIKEEQVLPLLKEGKSYQEIAEITGFTRNSIGRFCRKHYGLLEDRGKSTRQSINITNKQKEILFGSLLGDCCLAKHTKTYRGHIVHSVKQLEYAKWLHKELSNIAGKFRFIKVKAGEKIYDECQFTIRPNLELDILYKSFYEDFNGRKDIPYNLTLLTPLAIAIWFMDDGFLLNNGHSKSLGFSTCSFSRTGLRRLQKFLKENYNIETIIRRNNYLIVKRKSAKTLKDIISNYIIPTMKYKIDLD